MNEQTFDIVMGSIMLLFFAGWISLLFYCIFDIQKRRTKYLSDKAKWLNIVFLTPFGCLIYLMNRKRTGQSPNSSL